MVQGKASSHPCTPAIVLPRGNYCYGDLCLSVQIQAAQCIYECSYIRCTHIHTHKWWHTIHTVLNITQRVSYIYLSIYLPHSPSTLFKKNYLFYFWLRWVFIAARGLSLVAASGGYTLLRCAGFSLLWLLLLRSTGSRCAAFSSCGTRAQ